MIIITPEAIKFLEGFIPNSKPHLKKKGDIWTLKCGDAGLHGPDWKELLRIYYTANPVRIAKYA